jgi:hypothetical protein
MDDSQSSGGFAPNAPLRLSVAAKLAFPDGSMTASGLRREADRGRLRIERIAGKDYTSLDEIKRMRELCRVRAKEPNGTNQGRDTMEDLPTRQSGSSRGETAISPQDALRARLKQSRLQHQTER